MNMSKWQEARRTCEICGERLDPPQGKSPNNKFNHYKKRHPEIQFHQRRQSTEGHTRKTCDLCHKIFKDYGDLVTHYRDRHGFTDAIIMETKRCNRCHEEKQLSEFYKNKARKGGLQPECKVCHNQRRAKEILDAWNAPVNPPVNDPIQSLDNFFDGMGKVTGEIKFLRQENQILMGNINQLMGEITAISQERDDLKDSNNTLTMTIAAASKELDNWKFKALKWSGQLVSLQEILARPSR